jgi:hypothetical protein
VTGINIRLAEGVVVGPDDRLIIKIATDSGWDEDMLNELSGQLETMGIRDRTLILVGDIEFAHEVGFAKVQTKP